MKSSTAAYFNDLAREIAADPKALEKRFEADMRRAFSMVPTPNAPEPMEETP